MYSELALLVPWLTSFFCQHLQKELPPNNPIPTEHIGSIRMGTTVATNALLERKGEPIALVINKGFRDLLHIGNQARPKLFDLNIVMPEVLYAKVRLPLRAPSAATLCPGRVYR